MRPQYTKVYTDQILEALEKQLTKGQGKYNRRYFTQTGRQKEFIIIKKTCDFFVEPNWIVGNLTEGRIADFLNSDKQKECGKIKSILP